MTKLRVTTNSGTVYLITEADGIWTWERAETTEQSGDIPKQAGKIICDHLTRLRAPTVEVGKPLWFWTDPADPADPADPSLLRTSRVVKIDLL